MSFLNQHTLRVFPLALLGSVLVACGGGDGGGGSEPNPFGQAAPLGAADVPRAVAATRYFAEQNYYSDALDLLSAAVAESPAEDSPLRGDSPAIVQVRDTVQRHMARGQVGSLRASAAEQCPQGGTISEEVTASQTAVIFNNCKLRDDYGSWWFEYTLNGHVTVKDAEVDGYADAADVTFDLRVDTRDPEDAWRERFRGGMVYASNAFNDYALMDADYVYSDVGVTLGYGYADGVKDFNLVVTPGPVTEFRGQIGSSGVTWWDGPTLGGAYEVETIEPLQGWVGNPSAGTVTIKSGSNTLQVEYVTGGVNVSLNGGASQYFAWGQLNSAWDRY